MFIGTCCELQATNELTSFHNWLSLYLANWLIANFHIQHNYIYST